MRAAGPRSPFSGTLCRWRLPSGCHMKFHKGTRYHDKSGVDSNLFNFLPLATSEHLTKEFRSPQGSSMTEWWIRDPSINYASKTLSFLLGMYEIPLDTFTTNLGVVLDTLWLAGLDLQPALVRRVSSWSLILRHGFGAEYM